VRTVGTVSAGVYFFSPPVFLRQEPDGQQRKRLMVMPTDPIANLILGQPRITLRPPKAFLDSMLRFGHAGKLRQSRFGQGIGEIYRTRMIMAQTGVDEKDSFGEHKQVDWGGGSSLGK